jgi:hypothetical protein
LGGIRTGLLCEDLFKGFRPLHTVVQTFKSPEILEKVKEGRVSVLGVGFIHGTLLVDQRVGGDPRRDQKGRNATDRISLSLYTRWTYHSPNTKAVKVEGNVEALGLTIEGDSVFGDRDVHGRCDVVRKSTVLVEVQDNQAVCEIYQQSVVDADIYHDPS